MKLLKTIALLFLIFFSASVFSLSITSPVIDTSSECRFTAQRGLDFGEFKEGDDCNLIVVERENRTNYVCHGTIPICYAIESDFYTAEELQEIENRRIQLENKLRIQSLSNSLSYYFFLLLVYLIVPSFILYFSKKLLTKRILMVKLAITEANIILIFVAPNFILISILLSAIVQAILSIILLFKFKKIQEGAKLKTAVLIVLLAELPLLLLIILSILLITSF